MHLKQLPSTQQMDAAMVVNPAFSHGVAIVWFSNDPDLRLQNNYKQMSSSLSYLQSMAFSVKKYEGIKIITASNSATNLRCVLNVLSVSSDGEAWWCGPYFGLHVKHLDVRLKWKYNVNEKYAKINLQHSGVCDTKYFTADS